MAALKPISTYLKQAIVRQENAEALRKNKSTPAKQIEQADRDALIYTMIAHTMALENERFIREHGKAVYE